MLRRLSAISLATLVVAAGPAYSAEITVDGAKALADEFARYIGKEAFDKGYVSITPRGESYLVTLDAEKLATLVPNEFGSITVDGNAAFTAEPLDDGTWRVRNDSTPSSVTMTLNPPHGPETFTYTFDGPIEGDGIFDPSLGVFRSYTGRSNGFSMTGPGVQAEEKNISVTMSGTAVSDGVSDIEGNAGIDSLDESFTIPDAPPMQLSVRQIGQDFAVKALKGRAILDLLAFIVAHNKEDKLAAENESEFKSLVNAALPLFDRHDQTLTMASLAVESPMGPVTMDNFGMRFAMSGLVAKAEMSLGVTAENLAFPPVGIPPWAVQLVPTAFDVGLGVDGMDLEAPSKLFVSEMDINDPKPVTPQVEEQLAKLALPTGKVHVTIQPTTVSSSLYTANATGDFDIVPAEPQPIVEGTATITMKGLDETMAAIQAEAANDPEAAGAAMGLTFAKGLAKTNPDGSATWEIAVAADGSVRINGQMMVPPSR